MGGSRYLLSTEILLEEPWKGRYEFYVRDTGLTANEVLAVAFVWLDDPRRTGDVVITRASGKVELVLV